MYCQSQAGRKRHRNTTVVLAWTVLLASVLTACPASAQTYVSAEPIPSQEVVGQENLTKILKLGYPRLKLWSERLLCECRFVQNVIDTLADNGAITTITPANTDYTVAAGGFEGLTDPSYVFTIEDSGPFAASAADIFMLDNALGYVLNQSGTAQFSLPYDPSNSYEFPLSYAVVTFREFLTGEDAAEFFDYLGTIDPALWTGANAGFTQINLKGSHRRNSMLFLIGDVSTQEFVNGIFKAASTTPDARYTPLTKNGQPTTATAGVAFPGNDWIASPNGEEYLVNLINASPQLLDNLAAFRKMHLRAVSNLLKAIDKGKTDEYLIEKFRCPQAAAEPEDANFFQ